MALTERQQAMLELERSVWQLDDPKDVVIRARFACAPDAYYAELNTLIDLAEALDFDPLVVRRLRRLRDRRRRARLDGTAQPTEGGRSR